MAKKDRTLDTPFRRGERVQTVRPVDRFDEGATGKVKVANGLGLWRRYWVRFDDGTVVGQVSHEDLVRPWQFDEWLAREHDRELAAQRSEEDAAAAVAAADSSNGGEGDGVASQIPAHLLERSKAAKQRLLG